MLLLLSDGQQTAFVGRRARGGLSQDPLLTIMKQRVGNPREKVTHVAAKERIKKKRYNFVRVNKARRAEGGSFFFPSSNQVHPPTHIYDELYHMRRETKQRAHTTARTATKREMRPTAGGGPSACG